MEKSIDYLLVVYGINISTFYGISQTPFEQSPTVDESAGHLEQCYGSHTQDIQYPMAMQQEPICFRGTTTIYKAYLLGLCKGISQQNRAKNMAQYLHFKILNFPL